MWSAEGKVVVLLFLMLDCGILWRGGSGLIEGGFRGWIRHVRRLWRRFRGGRCSIVLTTAYRILFAISLKGYHCV